MRPKYKRHSPTKVITTVLGSIAALALLVYAYTFQLEPRWVTVERTEIALPELPSQYLDFNIVCISDLHHEPYNDLTYLRRVVRRVNQLEPDLICLLGDYVYGQSESITALAPVLTELSAPLGVYAVLGNHDLWTDAEEVRDGLVAAGIPVLINQSIALGGDAGFVLAGLDDAWSGEPDLTQALAGVPPNASVILMLHEPDFADQMARESRIKIQLSGHSHGGQVRIPFFGAPFLPAFARKYDQGLYRVGSMYLYVTRGIGVISPPGRFNCRPEITQITLVRSGP